MNLERLRQDWEDDPQLQHCAFVSVEALAAHLRKAHAEMMDGKHGCLGYLYRQQTLRIRQLQSARTNPSNEEIRT